MINNTEQETNEKSIFDAWLQASSDVTQAINAANSPQRILINREDGYQNINLNTTTGRITVPCGGKYMIIAAPQAVKKTICPCCCQEICRPYTFRCWFRVNGKDVPNTNVLLNLTYNTKDVIVTQAILDLNRNSVLEVMMASDNPNKGVLIEAISPSISEPLVPSIIFSMHKI